jgi:hypothetical protein
MKYIIQISLILALLVLGAQDVYSCSCGDTTARKQFRHSAAVFVGQVVNIKVSGDLNAAKLGYPYEITLQVEKSWKGAKGSKAVILSDNGLMGCSLRFQEGQRYLVYARSQEKYLYDTLCSRTTTVENASEDLAKLNDFWYRFFVRLFPF